MTKRESSPKKIRMTAKRKIIVGGLKKEMPKVWYKIHGKLKRLKIE